jgi:hypothetical protein
VFSGLASPTSLLPVSVSIFSYLRNDFLATALPLSVASLDAPKLFVPTETARNSETSSVPE